MLYDIISYQFSQVGSCDILVTAITTEANNIFNGRQVFMHILRKIPARKFSPFSTDIVVHYFINLK
jgi:hypothetical protein